MATGYGPRQRLLFDGDESKFQLWEVKFLGYMRLQKLSGVFESDSSPSANKNADAFAELVQCLDDRSLSLIITDAKDDGKKALDILREHYVGKSKPRIISLYTELTSLKMASDESTTDYVIRAETAANSLKSAGEEISDSLLIAMILKGLLPMYKTFSTVITQRDQMMEFTEFKVALRSYEETEKCTQVKQNSDNVMNTNSKVAHSNIVCFKCGRPGHKKTECRVKSSGNKNKASRWCTFCKSGTHDTDYCRKKNSAKSVSDAKPDLTNDESHTFAFKTIDFASKSSMFQTMPKNSLLVDCGATTHIVCDKSKFISFDDPFNPSSHFIKLADGSKPNNIAR